MSNITFWATCDGDSIRRQWMPAGHYLLPASSFLRRGFRTPPLPEGCTVAADWGGFVVQKRWKGELRFSDQQYIDWLDRIPNLSWAATWDLPCEPELVAGPGEIRRRQVWTHDMAEWFVEQYGDKPWAWVPSLQGYDLDDYKRSADDLEPLIRLLQSTYWERPGYLYDYGDPDPEQLARAEQNATDFRIGIGSLCARKDVADIRRIVEYVADRFPGIPLHLWGVKLAALKDWPGGIPEAVVSTDSAAWNGRFGSDIPQLNAEMARLGYSQREFGFKVQLPRYLERFAQVTTTAA